MPFAYQKYGKAQVRLLADNESCTMVMAQTFLDLYTHVSQVGRELKETAWHRMKTDGQPHPLSFLPGEGRQPWYKVTLTRSLAGGEWELMMFPVRSCFATALPDLPQPAFLNRMSVRCGLAEDAHYLVPLLTSPWRYTTYRGS